MTTCKPIHSSPSPISMAINLVAEGKKDVPLLSLQRNIDKICKEWKIDVGAFTRLIHDLCNLKGLIIEWRQRLDDIQKERELWERFSPLETVNSSVQAELEKLTAKIESARAQVLSSEAEKVIADEKANQAGIEKEQRSSALAKAKETRAQPNLNSKKKTQLNRDIPRLNQANSKALTDYQLALKTQEKANKAFQDARLHLNLLEKNKERLEHSSLAAQRLIVLGKDELEVVNGLEEAEQNLSSYVDDFIKDHYDADNDANRKLAAKIRDVMLHAPCNCEEGRLRDDAARRKVLDMGQLKKSV